MVRDLWEQQPGPLVGVPTGESSGLDVLDIDPRNGGATWFARHRDHLPPTRVHRTRSGGVHLLFKHQTGIRCSAARLAAGVDVRADGGYVIWWPAAELPVLSDAPWADWPEAFLCFLQPKVHINPRIVIADNVSFRRLVRAVVAAKPGERNNLAYWAACRAGEMVASGLLSAHTAAAVIAEAGIRAGLTPTEARRTAWSGIQRSGGSAHG